VTSCRLLWVPYCWLAFTAVLYPLRAYAGPVLLNGSFEGPPLAPNSFSAGGGTSWTPSGSVFIFSNNFDNDGTTPFGTQYLGLTDPNASDQQTVSGFLAGQSYILDMFFADAANNASPQLTVTISGAASALGVFNAPVSGPNGTDPYPFQEAMVPFTTTIDGNVTFLLTSTGGAGVVVDNVFLDVPEASPDFAMILLTATMALGFCRRSAKARVNARRRSTR
jgi:hypothetical protein